MFQQILKLNFALVFILSINLFVNGLSNTFPQRHLNEFPIFYPETEKVRIDFFFEPLSEKTSIFLRSFHEIFKNLKDQIEFTPHYIFQTCKNCSENGFKTAKENCVSGGRYCIENPGLSTLKGKDIIIQGLKEICIYQTSANKWWEYQLELAACNRTCFADIEAKIQLDPEKINECVLKSFEGKIDVYDNTLLRREKEKAQSFSIDHPPKLLINKDPFSSLERNSSMNELVKKICESFFEVPSYCKSKNIMTGKEDNLVLTLILVVLIFGGVGFTWHFYTKSKGKKGRDETGIQLDHMVSQYFALGDEGDVKSTERKSTIEI